MDGRTDVRTDGHLRPSLLGRLGGVDLIITQMIFTVLLSWQSHCMSSPGSFDECRLSAEVTVNTQTKPTDLDCESARMKWQLPSTSTVAILLLLSPRADTHFTVPRRVEG